MDREIKRPILRHEAPKRRRKAQRQMPLVPPLCPAALEPTWLRGRLILPPNPALGSDFVVLAAALRLVRAEICALAGDAERNGRIDERTIACLRNVATRIPAFVPAQNEFFFLAHVKGFLQASSSAVHETWPELLAKRYDEVTCHFDRTLQQVPKWRDFICNAEKEQLTKGEIEGLPALADRVVAALREDFAKDLIDPVIPAALEAFYPSLHIGTGTGDKQLPGDRETNRLLLANDLLVSIDNIAKRTAEAALPIGCSSLSSAAAPLAIEVPASEGQKDGEAYSWMKRTLAGIVDATPASALRARFFWLEPIVAMLGHS